MAEKQWRCQKCGAVLGMIKWNGNHVPTLMLLRHSIDMQTDVPEEVDVMGPLIGQMPVRCETCDHVSFWDISVDALVELIRGLEPKHFTQLQSRLADGRRKDEGRRMKASFE